MNWSNAFTARIRSSAFAKDTAVLSLGTIGAQVLTIAAMPVMSRLYSPADFGLLAIFTAVSSVVATAVTLRYETTILLPKDDAESNSIVLLSLALALSLGFFCGVAAWLLPDKFRSLLGVSELGNWLPMAALAGLASAVLATGSAWLNRQREYVKMAQLRIIQNAVVALAGLGLGYSGTRSGLMHAQVIALAVACAFIGTRLLPMLANWNSRSVADAGRKHQAAPKLLLPTALLDVVTTQLPVLLITGWFNSETAGQYSMAWRILGLPMALVGAAIGQVFSQRFSQAWPDQSVSRQLLIRTWTTLTMIGLLPTIVLMAYGEPIFKWVLGDAWGEAGVIAEVIAPMLFVMFVSSPTSTTFLVLGFQKYSLIFGIAVLIYRPLCLLLGKFFGSLYVGLYILVFIEILQISLYQYLAWRRINNS